MAFDAKPNPDDRLVNSQVTDAHNALLASSVSFANLIRKPNDPDNYLSSDPLQDLANAPSSEEIAYLCDWLSRGTDLVRYQFIQHLCSLLTFMTQTVPPQINITSRIFVECLQSLKIVRSAYYANTDARKFLLAERFFCNRERTTLLLNGSAKFKLGVAASTSLFVSRTTLGEMLNPVHSKSEVFPRIKGITGCFLLFSHNSFMSALFLEYSHNLNNLKIMEIIGKSFIASQKMCRKMIEREISIRSHIRHHVFSNVVGVMNNYDEIEKSYFLDSKSYQRLSQHEKFHIRETRRQLKKLHSKISSLKNDPFQGNWDLSMSDPIYPLHNQLRLGHNSKEPFLTQEKEYLVSDFMREIITATETEFKCRIHLQVDPPNPSVKLPYLRIDKSYLTSIVEQVMQNAAKYNLDDCDIHSRIYASAGSLITIQVENFCEPIDEAERYMLSRSGYRASNALRSRQLGSGLGLSEVRAKCTAADIAFTFELDEGMRAFRDLSLFENELIKDDKVSTFTVWLTFGKELGSWD